MTLGVGVEVRVVRVEVAGTDCDGLVCDVVRVESVLVPVLVPGTIRMYSLVKFVMVLVTVGRVSLCFGATTACRGAKEPVEKVGVGVGVGAVRTNPRATASLFSSATLFLKFLAAYMNDCMRSDDNTTAIEAGFYTEGGPGIPQDFEKS